MPPPPTTRPDATGGAPVPRRRVWAVAAVLALVLQVAVLYTPVVPDVPGTAVPGADKVVHAAVFAAVTLTGLRAGVSGWVVAAYGLAHAGVSEALQHVLLAGRTGDGGDVVADVVGVAAGLVAGWWLSLRDGR